MIWCPTEMNKAIIQRYFDAYNNKNETILDEIISSDYVDRGQTAYMLAWEAIRGIVYEITKQ